MADHWRHDECCELCPGDPYVPSDFDAQINALACEVLGHRQGRKYGDEEYSWWECRRCKAVLRTEGIPIPASDWFNRLLTASLRAAERSMANQILHNLQDRDPKI